MSLSPDEKGDDKSHVSKAEGASIAVLLRDPRSATGSGCGGRRLGGGGRGPAAKAVPSVGAPLASLAAGEVRPLRTQAAGGDGHPQARLLPAASPLPAALCRGAGACARAADGSGPGPASDQLRLTRESAEWRMTLSSFFFPLFLFFFPPLYFTFLSSRLTCPTVALPDN